MQRWLIGLFLLALVWATPVAAQQSFGITPSNTSTQAISVTTSSSSITLDTKTGSTVVIANTGSNTAYITNTATATTTGFPIPAGSSIAFNFQPGSVISAITSSSTTTLLVGKGSGPTALAGGGTSGGGGGAVTIADGADVTQGALADAACATDNGTCSVAAVLKRIAQRITTLITNIANTIVLQAGENHIGEVGGNILPITNAMTTSNATVTTGQSIGGIQTLANAVRVSGSLGASGTSGIIQSVVLTFLDAVGSGPLDVYFYNATVTTGSNCQNATTFVLQTADRTNVLGVAHVTDFTASNTAAVAQANNLAIPFGLASATSLFACVVARGSFAITGTANASLKVNVLRN